MVVQAPSPLPLNTRRVIPRFFVPKSKKARQNLRPILQYTKTLNSLPNNTWNKLKLCDPNEIN